MIRYDMRTYTKRHIKALPDAEKHITIRKDPDV